MLGDADVVLGDPVVLVKDAVRETGVAENIETLAKLHSKLEAKVKRLLTISIRMPLYQH